MEGDIVIKILGKVIANFICLGMVVAAYLAYLAYSRRR